MDIVDKESINGGKEYTWNETELNEFREIVRKEKGLKSRTDDIFLLSFLRSRKYDKDAALTLLKNYYAIRKSIPELKYLRPSALEHVLKSNIMTHLPIEAFRLLAIGRTSHWDVSKISTVDLCKCTMLHVDFILNDHLVQVHGVSLLIDAKHLSWRHVITFRPRILTLIAQIFYKTVPMSYKSIHFVNCNTYIFAIMTLLFPFLPKKLKQRMHFYGSNFEELHKEIDPKYLPVEFGGKLLSLDWAESNQTIRDNEEFFVENEKYWNEERNN